MSPAWPSKFQPAPFFSGAAIIVCGGVNLTNSPSRFTRAQQVIPCSSTVNRSVLVIVPALCISNCRRSFPSTSSIPSSRYKTGRRMLPSASALTFGRFNPFPISSVMLYRQLVPGVVGITGAANTELRPKQQTATQRFLTLLIRMFTRRAQGSSGRSSRAQTTFGYQARRGKFLGLKAEDDDFHYKPSHKCHSERSETATQPRIVFGARPGFQSRINFRGILPRANEQRCLKAWPHASHFVAALRST